MSQSAHPKTLVEAIARLSESMRSVTVYDRRGRTMSSRPYPEVHTRARAWGAWFREQGVSGGDVVFLCLPTSHDLIQAFLGASLAGALPCMLATPRAIGGLDVFRRRLELLSGTFPGGQLLTTPDVGAESGREFWTVPEDLDTSRLIDLDPVDPDSLAYVQLTSGSTRAPKAVAISHGNLAANTWGICSSGQEDRGGDTVVSWLPLYHDMGLVGIVLNSFFRDLDQVLMRPETFVGSPLRWLEAIAATPGITATTAPNFAYQWCVDRIREDKLEGLDLSSWRVALCGAEAIRPATLSAFCERFAPCGIGADIFLPCYGMAETTLAVTLCPPGREPLIRNGRVSCGAPIAGLQVEIRDPESGEILGGEAVGEIVVKGTSIFKGYYRNPEATAEVLRDGAFFTGDLGYMCEGELYVTGRLKDLIILDGANVAPFEIEWIAEEHIVVAGGRAAAFAVEVGTREMPVLLAEVREIPCDESIARVLKQVAEDIAPLHDLVLVRRGSLPKTSSGKVQRSKTKALYLAGEFDALWSKLVEAAKTEAT